MYYIDIYIIMIWLLYWYVSYVDMYDILISIQYWFVCYIDLYIIIMCMLYWHVTYIDMYVILIPTLHWYWLMLTFEYLHVYNIVPRRQILYLHLRRVLMCVTCANFVTTCKQIILKLSNVSFGCTVTCYLSSPITWILWNYECICFTQIYMKL